VFHGCAIVRRENNKRKERVCMAIGINVATVRHNQVSATMNEEFPGS
jgi:hypothetical protein